jgi:hypothetical protein
MTPHLSTGASGAKTRQRNLGFPRRAPPAQRECRRIPPLPPRRRADRRRPLHPSSRPRPSAWMSSLYAPAMAGRGRGPRLWSCSPRSHVARRQSRPTCQPTTVVTTAAMTTRSPGWEGRAIAIDGSGRVGMVAVAGPCPAHRQRSIPSPPRRSCAGSAASEGHRRAGQIRVAAMDATRLSIAGITAGGSAPFTTREKTTCRPPAVVT